MSFLSPGERIYMSFTTSRKYPKALKYYLSGLILLVIAVNVILSIVPLPSEIIGIQIGTPITSLLVVCGLMFLLMGELRRRRFGTFHITNYRIVFTRGFLGTNMDSVSYSMIVNVKVTQNFIEQILGVGNLDISTAKGNREIDMTGIANPSKIENMIYNFMGGRTGPAQRQVQPRAQYRQAQKYPQAYRRRR